MHFPTLAGNDNLKQALSDVRSLESGAIILSGPSGSGKRTAARDMAMGLLCTGEPAPCGCCGACIRMKAGSHPDYELLNAECAEIKVDMVRALKARSFIRPSEARYKVFVLCAADKMNPQSQNALLKVLEEPASTVFILLCENSESLLPTVRSRSLHYRLEPLGEELLVGLLSQRFPAADSQQLQKAAAASGGFLGTAIAALSGDESETIRLARQLIVALQQDELAVLTCCMELSRLSREDYALFCDVFCQQLLDVVRRGAENPGDLLTLYEYVEEQKAKTAFNASVTALSGALAAFCGENLKLSWRK